VTNVLVLQHISCEPPGIFEDVLVARGATITRVELDAGEPIPALTGFDALVVMGGPMGAYEEERFPWIADELVTIAEAVERRMPVLGVCLGAQLLARAAGGTAFVGHGPEVGVLPVRLTAAAGDDHVFGDLPATFTALQWHGDTFDLPPDAVLLASSDEYPNQAFCVGTAYGIQFHVEVTSAMAQEWAEVPAYAAALDAVRGPGSLPGLLAEFEEARVSMQRVAETIGHRFGDLVAASAGDQLSAFNVADSVGGI
jgi:GMP synthase (glutamine-hydrolysing)